VAAIEWLLAGVFMSWLFRKKLIPFLSHLWTTYDGERLDALRSHVSDELVSLEDRVRAALDAHHDRIVETINGNGNRGAGGD